MLDLNNKNIDVVLVEHAVNAVRDPSRWQRVLTQILAQTGAKAAMITLREQGSCQIVNDNALEEEYHSPLISGFSLENIVFYLQELRTIDPWAEAQRTHYPHRPTVMSNICPVETVEQTRFFDWLTSLGIEESVVFELHRFPQYWTACNLFFETRGSDEAQAGKEYLDRHFKLLKEAWQSSQELVQQRQFGQAALERLENPACIINPSSEVLLKNSQFDQLLLTGSVKVVGQAQRLSVTDHAVLRGADSFKIARHECSEGEIDVFSSVFHPDPLHSGKRERLQLMVFHTHKKVLNGGREIDEVRMQDLTSQERLMFDAVQSGANVAEAGSRIGVKRSRAFDIWAGVKEKLNISSAHQVREY